MRVASSELIEVPLVAHHLPFNEVFQLVGISNHGLVVSKLLVRLDNSQINSSEIDLP